MSDTYLALRPEGKDWQVVLHWKGKERASTLFCWWEMDMLQGWMEGMINVFERAEEEEESSVQEPETESSCNSQGQEEGDEEEGDS